MIFSSYTLLKYIFRAALLLALTLMIYVALLPSYEFGDWVPTPLLHSAGVPEFWIKLLLDHADKIAHTFGALTISMLYFLSLSDSTPSQPNPLQLSATTFLGLLFTLALTAEIVQLWIGRNFSFMDIFAGMLGGGMAIAILNFGKRGFKKANRFQP